MVSKKIGKGFYFPIIADEVRMREEYKKSLPLSNKLNKQFGLVGQKVILFVGRLSKEKGLSYLLDIWKIIECKYDDWKLIIVGDGESRKFVEKQVIKLKLKRCFLEGFQSPEVYYNKSKIFCVTSLFEGFGLVLVEAMKFGVVPVAFNSYPNACDIIDNSINGFLVSPFDIDAYAKRLSELIEDEDKLNKMSTKAVLKSESFDMNMIGIKWVQLINEISLE